MTEWLAMPHTLYAHVWGSMGDQSTVSNMPYSMLASRGGQSRNSARHRDRTTDLTVCSPTPPPLHQCGGCIVRLVYSIYNSSSWNCCSRPHYVVPARAFKVKLKKLKLQNANSCCDVAMWLLRCDALMLCGWYFGFYVWLWHIGWCLTDHSWLLKHGVVPIPCDDHDV